MSEWCARVVTMLALVPLAYAIGVLAAPVHQSAQIISLAATVVWLGSVFALWRRYVRWSVLRSCSTLGVAAVVMLQVIAWVPAVRTSCFNDEVCMSQSITLLGASTLAWCAIWWGRGRTARRPGPTSTHWRWRMRPDAVRLAVGIAMCPFLFGLFWFTVFLTDANDPEGIAGVYLFCAIVAAAVWIPLWRPRVTWNPRRIWGTVALTAALVMSPAALLLPDSSSGTLLQSVVDALRLNAPVLMCAVWLAGTAWLWCAPAAPLLTDGPTVQQDAVEPVCPHCGYSLRGLTAVRCPECGWTSTIDDVVRRTLDDLAMVT